MDPLTQYQIAQIKLEALKLLAANPQYNIDELLREVEKIWDAILYGAIPSKENNLTRI